MRGAVRRSGGDTFYSGGNGSKAKKEKKKKIMRKCKSGVSEATHPQVYAPC